MFDHFFKTCVAAVSDAEELNRMKDALSAAGIRYECRMKDLNRRNAFDQARTGGLGIKPKFATEILVDKKGAAGSWSSGTAGMESLWDAATTRSADTCRRSKAECQGRPREETRNKESPTAKHMNVRGRK